MINEQIPTSTCCTCGYSWQTGQTGNHSCSEHLIKERDKLKQEVERLQRLVDGAINPKITAQLDRALACAKELAAALEKAKTYMERTGADPSLREPLKALSTYTAMMKEIGVP